MIAKMACSAWRRLSIRIVARLSPELSNERGVAQEPCSWDMGQSVMRAFDWRPAARRLAGALTCIGLAAVLVVAAATGAAATEPPLSPAQQKETEAYARELQKKLAPLQQELQACGANQRCMMEVSARIMDVVASMRLPAMEPYQARDCGLLASTWSYCVPVTLSFKYSYDSELHSYFESGPHRTSKETLAFTYSAPGVLGYDADFRRFRLFQRRPPRPQDMNFQGGQDTGWDVNQGVPTVVYDRRLGQVNWDRDPTPMITFFSVEAEDAAGPALLSFMPPAPFVGPMTGDDISGQPVPPDGYGVQPVDRAALKALLQPEGVWRFQETYHKRYDDIGSRYLLRFEVSAVAAAPSAPPPLASATPPPDKKPGRLQVSPAEAFEARRRSVKETFKPRAKSYVLTNSGEQPLNFAVAAGAGWAKADPASGALAPKASQNVTLRLTAAADALGDGRHETQARFRNVTNGQGNTQRKIVLRQIERWRFSVYGHNVRYFGSGQIVGGLRVSWRTDVDFEVEDGKYKRGQGRTYFTGLDSYAKPLGAFDCKSVKGEYLDKALTSHPTPYIRYKSYPVSGHVSGKTVTLNLPKENLYAVGYQCVTNVKALKQHFANSSQYPKGYGDYIAKTTRKEAKVKDAYPLPSGPHTGDLKDGWVSKKGTKQSIDFDAMTMKRLD